MALLPILYVATKNYSSWSMRPWLALRWGEIAFEERLIALGPRDGTRNADMARISPTAQLPALHLPDGQILWDSLAICEWAAENAPSAGLWPADNALRALARCASAEMHSGFAALRRDLPMNIRRRAPPRALSGETGTQIARLVEIWAQCQAGAGGPFLFGARPNIADAFYAPMATRLRTYAIDLPAKAAAYVEAILHDPQFQAWELAAMAEQHAIPETDCA